MAQSPIAKWTFLSVACVAVVAAFLYLHTGSGGERLCSDHGFSDTPSLSFWPPGAKCEGGDPEIARVYFDPVFLVLIPGIYLVLEGLRLALASLLRHWSRG